MKPTNLPLLLGRFLFYWPTAYCLLPTLLHRLLSGTRSHRHRRELPGAYQVEVADVNGDKKPDIVAVGGSTCAWYENPTWKKRIVTGPKETPGIISSATADIDGDGKAEIAIAYEFGMNTPTKGKLLLAGQGSGLDDPWTFKRIGDIGSIHRLRWGDLDGRDGLDLIIAPLFGPEAKPPDYQQSAATILSYPANRKTTTRRAHFRETVLAFRSARDRGDRRDRRWTARYPDGRQRGRPTDH